MTHTRSFYHSHEHRTSLAEKISGAVCNSQIGPWFLKCWWNWENWKLNLELVFSSDLSDKCSSLCQRFFPILFIKQDIKSDSPLIVWSLQECSICTASLLFGCVALTETHTQQRSVCWSRTFYQDEQRWPTWLPVYRVVSRTINRFMCQLMCISLTHTHFCSFSCALQNRFLCFVCQFELIWG